MQKCNYRIDVGRWTLSRCNGHPQFKLEPDPLVIEPIEIPDDPEPVTDRAAMFRHLLESGEVRNRAGLAERFGISRARVTQILGPINNTNQKV